MHARKHRIALINSIVDECDAISASVRDMAIALEHLGHEVRIFCYHTDYDDLPFQLINGNLDLLLDDYFVSADLLIWHFGIFYEAFATLAFGNGRAPRIVAFHNVTPEAYVPESSRPLIRRSLEQAHLLPLADEIWAVSDINRLVALELGAAPESVVTVPLQVDAPALASAAAKSQGPIEMLYVGRFAKAKGVLDLLAGYRAAKASGAPIARLTLAGNVNFSDQNYLEQVREFIRVNDLAGEVKIAEMIDDEELHSLYLRAHILGIASSHEGFCKPVVEALRSGCIPLGYASYNIPYVANGLGALVQPGDVEALGNRLNELATSIRAALKQPDQPLLEIDQGKVSIRDFDRLRQDHVARFEAASVSKLLSTRVSALMANHQDRILAGAD